MVGAYDLIWFLPDSEQYLAPWLRYSRYNTQEDVPSGFIADDEQDRRSRSGFITSRSRSLSRQYRYLDARSDRGRVSMVPAFSDVKTAGSGWFDRRHHAE
jgi:hypothetical protein